MNWQRLFALLWTAAIVSSVGCGDDAPVTPADSSVPDAVAPDGSAPDGSTLDGGVPDGSTPEALPEIDALTAGDADFTIATLAGQSYWYSRYNLGSLVMKSGAGETFPPNPTMVAMMVSMVSDDLSTAAPASNPALLRRVYDLADPTFLNASDGDPSNFANGRWDAATFTETTRASTFGWVAIKELEWAKQFHVDAHFGVPGDNDIPGAQQRFAGMVLFVEAVQQTMAYLNEPASFDNGDVAGRHIALLALSDLVGMLEAPAIPHSTTNRYRQLAGMMAVGMGLDDVDALASVVRDAADALYAELDVPTTIAGQANAFQGLTWYAAHIATNRDGALARMRTIADAMVAAEPVGPVQTAHAIRTLSEADRIFAGEGYGGPIRELVRSTALDFDGAIGVFASQSEYSCDDIAVILSALNTLLVFAGGDVWDTALAIALSFYESAVNLGGMQIAAPPVASLPEYEHMTSEMFHRHPAVPMPPAAGGDFGVAPVYSSAIEWNGAAWGPASPIFDAGQAMHLANEMLWMHVDEVNAFPEIP